MKHRSKKQAEQRPRIWLAVLPIVLVCVLAGVWNGESHEVISLREFAQIAHINLTKVVLFASDSTVRLRTAQFIVKGDSILTIPRRFCITPQSIKQSEAGRVLQKHTNSEFSGISQYAIFLALEKRNKLSQFQKWFVSIPSFSRETGGVLYWDSRDLECLDPRLQSEADQSFAALNATLRVSTLVAQELDLPPFDTEEIRWALAVYFLFNVRDQAVIPVLSYARYSNENEGVSLDVDSITGALVVRAGRNFAVGEELTQTFPRGPASQLVARGLFDPFSRGVDATLDIQTSLRDPLGKKLCVDHYDELLFQASGSPTKFLETCFAWLVMTEEERRIFAAAKDEPSVQRKVFEGLLEVVTEMSAQKPRCQVAGPLQQKLSDYADFVQRVCERNIEYLENQLSRL